MCCKFLQALLNVGLLARMFVKTNRRISSQSREADKYTATCQAKVAPAQPERWKFDIREPFLASSEFSANEMERKVGGTSITEGNTKLCRTICCTNTGQLTTLQSVRHNLRLRSMNKQKALTTSITERPTNQRRSGAPEHRARSALRS